MRDHSLIEELLAAAALDGLSQEDEELLASERASHGACQDCANLEAEFHEVAGLIGLSLAPVAGPAGAADAVLRRATRPGAAGLPGQPSQQMRPGGRWWRSAIAVAAALAMGLALFFGGWLLRGTPSSGVNASGARLVRFQGSAGSLAMAYAPGQPGAVFFGSQLPDLGAGNVYEVWIFQGQQPVSMTCLRPANGTVLQRSGGSVGTATQLAVTVESSACPSAPTTEPVFSATIG